MYLIRFSFLLLAFATFSVVYATSLVPFKTCPSLLSYMVKNSVKRVGPWGLRPPSGCFFARSSSAETATLALSDDSASSGTSPPSPVEGVDFSGTNVQVQGVDEPDIVKTDGERVFTISKGRFFYVKVTKSGMDGQVLANVSIPSYPRDMLFDSKSDSVVIISQTYETLNPIRSPFSRRSFFPYYSSRPVIVLYRFSVKDEKNVKITDTAYIPGRYISARSVGGIARLVFSYDASDHIPFSSPSGKLTQQESTKLNINILKRTKLTDWIPTFNATGTYCRGQVCNRYRVKKPISDCSAVYYPKDQFSGFSLLSVATFNLNGFYNIKGSSIIADGYNVYATAKKLYASTTEYQFDLDEFDINSGRGFKTSFHKFELTGSTVKYVASGEVQGSVLNQFSMHEYKDTFFVATTEGSLWWRSRDESVSKVSSFRVMSNKLRKVGEVGGLGKGERIYAVRYIAEVAYVVTFRQVDPLYIVDLSNAYSLKVTGELKIPGYSAYLHPISPGRILGVGRDADARGRLTGSKVSLFDVSVVNKPKQLASWTLAGSYTSAEWEHKAFLWWGPDKIAVLPISIYYRGVDNKPGRRFRGSVVLDVSDTDITERGRITHSCCGRDWSRNIIRNFVIARTNLWSLSSNSLQVNGVEDLEEKSSVPFYTYFHQFISPIKPLLLE